MKQNTIEGTTFGDVRCLGFVDFIKGRKTFKWECKCGETFVATTSKAKEKSVCHHGESKPQRVVPRKNTKGKTITATLPPDSPCWDCENRRSLDDRLNCANYSSCPAWKQWFHAHWKAAQEKGEKLKRERELRARREEEGRSYIK